MTISEEILLTWPSERADLLLDSLFDQLKVELLFDSIFNQLKLCEMNYWKTPAGKAELEYVWSLYKVGGPRCPGLSTPMART